MTTPTPSDIDVVTRSVLRYLMCHPGAVASGPTRRRYSDGFRRHVIALCHTRRERLPEIARAISIPLPTLRRWLQRCEVADTLYDERDTGHEQSDAVSDQGHARPSDPSLARTDPDPEGAWRIVREWTEWRGSLADFCRHLDEHLHIRIGRAAVSRLLAAYGVRAIRSRRTATDACAAQTWRGSFERFFPGAQWVGDGTRMTIWMDEQPYTFNVELMVDTAHGAVVGASIRDEEDGTAVVEAFHDGVATTGATPLAVLLDNRPSNHTDAVLESLSDTRVLRATPGRPQNKAHAEGAFGLFKQVAPEFRVARCDASDKQLSRQILAMVITTWARTLNNRRPTRRSHRARVELYRGRACTPVQIDAALVSLDRRRRRARADKREPHPLHDFVCAQLRRLGLFSSANQPGPCSRLVSRLLRFPDHAIIDAIAIYRAKLATGTLPEDAGLRYLVGISRRLAENCEGFVIAEALWHSRWAASTAWRAELEARRVRLAERHTDEYRTLAYIDAAMDANRAHERSFWLDAAASELRHQHRADASASATEEARLFAGYKRAAHHILATDAIAYRERLALVRGLVARLVPLPA